MSVLGDLSLGVPRMRPGWTVWTLDCPRSNLSKMASLVGPSQDILY